MIFSHDLADSARNLIHAWRVTRGEADRRAVSSGPSREDLFDSLRLSREDRSVIFLIKPMASDFVSFPEADTNLPFEISVRVRRIESMGKSGCDWKIVLYDFNSTFGKPYLV
ncbi:MAG: hypothetical protein HZA95_00690, partial [Candidatus Vogelbacteria bacterium]|nr:hypothetical protein [Candidatus Vogelbacteria bacterium]